eukprot:gene12157-25510_t
MNTIDRAAFDENIDFCFDNSVVTIGPKIGEGEFSTVFIGKYCGDYVAVKKQSRQGNSIEQYLLRELTVLKYVHHTNLMGYIGAWNEVSITNNGSCAVYIVTEFCQGGDLLNLLLSPHELNWRFRVRLAMEASSALLHLHEHCILHRDIKSSNVLLDHAWTCKITDFGMARELPDDDNDRNTPR